MEHSLFENLGSRDLSWANTRGLIYDTSVIRIIIHVIRLLYPNMLPTDVFCIWKIRGETLLLVT